MRGYRFIGRSYGKKTWERWPKINETVVDTERDDRGPYGRGLIVHVDKDNKCVLVKFLSPPSKHFPEWRLCYKRVRGEEGELLDQPYYDMFWNATDTDYFMRTWVWNDWIEIDTNHREESASCDEVIQYQYYSFDDLRWSSHKGGVGAWQTRSYP